MNADRRIHVAAAALLIFAATAARAASSRVGTASGVFLRLPRTAREAALGGCGTGALGAAAIAKNPAAMGEQPGLVASHNEATGGEIAVDFLAATRHFGQRGAGGLSILHVSGGNVAQTDDNGQNIGGFTPRDIAATAGGACAWRAFTGGVSVSYLYSKIIHAAHAVTAGAGAEWHSSNLRTRAGFYASNIAGQFQYVDAKEPLPRSIRLGVRRELRRLGLVVEGVSPSDGAPYVASGVEIKFRRDVWGFVLRAGFDGGRARSHSGAGGLGAGAGISTETWSLDYAWSPGGEIGDDHLFTLGLRFRPSASSARTEVRPQ